MPLFNIFGKNPIKKLRHDELKDMELSLKVKSERLTKEVIEIDREIQQLFEKSKEAKSHLEEIDLASRIKTLAKKKEMKVAAHAELERELRAVSNLLVIKEYEVDLKAAGVWEPLQKIAPEELQKYLIDKKLEAEDRQGAVKAITELTGSVFRPTTEHEEDLDDILAVMREVKEDKLKPETASERISKQREEKELEG
jgi:hypothetical protein